MQRDSVPLIDRLALAEMIEKRGPWVSPQGIQLTKFECELIVLFLRPDSQIATGAIK